MKLFGNWAHGQRKQNTHFSFGVWKMAVFDKQSAVALQRALHQQMKQNRKASAMVLLQGSMARLVQGRTASLLRGWCSQSCGDTRARDLAERSDQLRREGATMRRKAAMRQMQQILSRRLQGTMAMRVDMWRGSMFEDYQREQVLGMEMRLVNEMNTNRRGVH